jgi:hypothetical protein
MGRWSRDMSEQITEQFFWHPSNIFDARDQVVTDRSGQAHTLKLYAGGWAWGPDFMGLDIWTACRLLNNRGATH